MEKQSLLPFKIGQVAESRSFMVGFRGAWFRCKIKEISWRKGQTAHALEYFDFPDERVKWTRLFQVPPTCRRSKETKKQLMVRPQYPPIYHEKELLHASAISEVAVVVSGAWKVGDLIDWWTDGCHWSGKVTQLLGNDKVQIELLPPPAGEGSSYEVFCKDLRPSLEWSPEVGWSVPLSKDGKKFRYCARLVRPELQAASVPSSEIDAVDKGTELVEAKSGSPSATSFSSHISADSLVPMDKSKLGFTHDTIRHTLSTDIPEPSLLGSESNLGCDIGNSATGIFLGSGGVSHSHVRDASAETAGHPAREDQSYCSGSLKKMRTNGYPPLNSTCSDTVEAAILDLEELANKVKWLKRILEPGVPISTAVRTPWMFIEHRASSTPK